MKLIRCEARLRLAGVTLLRERLGPWEENRRFSTHDKTKRPLAWSLCVFYPVSSGARSVEESAIR